MRSGAGAFKYHDGTVFEGSFGTFADSRRDVGYRRLSPLYTRIPTRSSEQAYGLPYTYVH
jgi:hypothetical protein